MSHIMSPTEAKYYDEIGRRLRYIFERDRTGEKFVGAWDYLVRSVFEAVSAPAGRLNYCEWIEEEQDGGIFWQTDCGHASVFIAGTPAENSFRICPYCGELIQEAHHEE